MSLRARCSWWWGLGAVLLLGMGTPAVAGNAISGISFQEHENYTTVGIKAIVQGDDDSSAVLRLQITTPAEYAAAGVTAFDSSMVMTRRQSAGDGGADEDTDAEIGNMFEGALIWLSPGTKYYWRCEYTDAGGGGGTSAIDSVTTRTIPNCPTSGVRWYVSKSGSDSNDGLTPGAAKLTIGAAITAMDAHASNGDNGGIVIAPGVYREKLTLNFGDQPGVTRFIAGDGTNPDSTIIDGSAAPGANQDLSWVPVSSGSADSTWYSIEPWADSISNVVLGYGEYIHKKTSKQEIFDNAMGEASGWFATSTPNETLFVKRRVGTTPAGLPLHAGYQGTKASLLDILKKNWIVKKLTFRFAGGTTSDSHGVVFGATSTNASGGVVDSCHFYGIAGRAHYNTLFAVNGRADSLIFARSTVRGLGIGHMTYQASKSRQEENSNRVQMQGRLALIYGSTFNSVSNGPTTFGAENDSTVYAYNEMSYNTVDYCSDDGLELDIGHAINCVVYKNTVRSAGSGISFTGIGSGPLYILYNTVSNFAYPRGGRGLKSGDTNGNGTILIYHNTVTTRKTDGTAHAYEAVGTPVEGMQFRNNILVGTGNGGASHSIQGGGSATTRVSFNYNLHDSAGTFRIAHWASTSYSIGTPPGTSTWGSSLAWDRNGTRAAPGFADSANKNFRLLSSSAAVNAGMRIVGVNTDYRGKRYTGQPDIGAHERNWPRRRNWLDRLRGVGQ